MTEDEVASLFVFEENVIKGRGRIIHEGSDERKQIGLAAAVAGTVIEASAGFPWRAPLFIDYDDFRLFSDMVAISSYFPRSASIPLFLIAANLLSTLFGGARLAGRSISDNGEHRKLHR